MGGTGKSRVYLGHSPKSQGITLPKCIVYTRYDEGPRAVYDRLDSLLAKKEEGEVTATRGR